MLTVSLTYEEAVGLLERAVAEKGSDYTYPRGVACAYFDAGGAPACLVGHVLHYAGMTLGALRTHQRDENDINTGPTVIGLHNLGVIDVDDRTLGLLDGAQRDQDQTLPWGVALERNR